MKITQSQLRRLIKEELNAILGEDESHIFAPNHYCIHHGGVQHEGKVKMAKAISHDYDRMLGKVTHYNMKLEDGTILENVAAEDIQVTKASLAEDHKAHPVGKRDSTKKQKKTKVSKAGQERVSKKIAHLIGDEGKSKEQAAAIAYSMEERGELEENKK